jgi:MFS family permease
VSERVRTVALILRDPKLGRLQLAFLGFNMTEYASWIAILVYAYGRGGAGAVGLISTVQLVPAGLIAPFGAFAADRFRRDRVLLVAYLVQAVALGLVAAALASEAPFVLIMASAVVYAVSFTFIRPTQAAILPSLADTPGKLTAANSVSTLAESAGAVAGPLLAGLMLGLSGPALVFGVFGVVTFAEAALVARPSLPPSSVRPRLPMTAGDVVRESLGGFRTLNRDRRAGLLVLTLALGYAVLASLDVLFVAVAIDLLGKGESWAGYLNAAAGIGGLVGAVATVSLVGRQRLVPFLEGGTGVLGASVAMVGVIASSASAPLLFGVAGAGGSVSWMAGSTLLQRAAPEDVLARVFGILEGLGTFGAALGVTGTAVLIGLFGVETTLIVVGSLLVAFALALWIPLASIDRVAEAPDAEALALVRSMHVFGALPPPALERILADLVPVHVEVGHVLMREGDPGDRCYLIAEGRAAVLRAGVRIDGTGAGELVGEIALLRDVPRTASVVAETPMRLLALEREPFLVAVTGHPQSRARAEALAEARVPRRHADGM